MLYKQYFAEVQKEQMANDEKDWEEGRYSSF